MVLLFLATACNFTALPQEANPDVVLTGQADGAPVGCSPEDITGHINEMLDAISRSDPNVVDEYFGRKNAAPFFWYSIGEFVAYSWDELDLYFQQRYQQHEQLQLRSIEFNGWEPERGGKQALITNPRNKLRALSGETGTHFAA